MTLAAFLIVGVNLLIQRQLTKLLQKQLLLLCRQLVQQLLWMGEALGGGSWQGLQARRRLLRGRGGSWQLLLQRSTDWGWCSSSWPLLLLLGSHKVLVRDGGQRLEPLEMVWQLLL